jgi:NAD(P)-dependent dehydrogenase (short-subunit alcohol dehydrogenase family)
VTAPVCVLVGSGPGLGAALARRFARGGFRVAALSRRPDDVAKGLRAEGCDVTPYAVDAGDATAMTAVLDRVGRELGAPTVLLYNAALIEPARFATRNEGAEVRYDPKAGWSARGEPADFDYLVNTFKTNVAGALHATQRVLPSMRKAGGGTIILTGGVLAFDPWLEWGVTALGKAALRSLGRSLALELSPEGIHVVTVAIHGTMVPGGPYDQDVVADAFWTLHTQPKAAWEAEFHFKVD